MRERFSVDNAPSGLEDDALDQRKIMLGLSPPGISAGGMSERLIGSPYRRGSRFCSGEQIAID